MGPETVNTILLDRVIMSQSQMPWPFQLAVAPRGLKMVRAELESLLSSFHRHLGDDDPGGPVSPSAAHPHGGLPPALVEAPWHEAADADRSWALGRGRPALQASPPLVVKIRHRKIAQ